MNKYRLSVFAAGTLFFTAAMLIVFSINKPNNKVNQFQKAEMFSQDNPYARIEYERKMLVDPSTGEIPYNIRAKELEYALTLPTTESNSLNKTNLANWSMRGPINRGGRTRALGIDVRTQTPPNITILAGGASGGIFKSTDNGVTWINKLSPSNIHSVTCMVQDTRAGQENTWYAGTGEAIGSADGGGDAFFGGDGIHKSTDNGETWNLMPSTSNGAVHSFNSPWRFVNSISINNATGSIFAAASNVVMRSQDGGANWNTVRSGLTNATMSDVKITSTGVIYSFVPSGFTDAGISVSNDDGSNWTNITPAGFPAAYGRGVIAIAPSNENIVYFWVYDGIESGPSLLWKLDASSNTWSNLTANLPATVQPVTGLSVQGAYNMILKVKPDDQNFVIIGATNLYRSTDGFATQVQSSGWIGGYAKTNDIDQYDNHHPDQHSLVFLNAPNSNVLYSGHDGGISRTDDVNAADVSWSLLNTGYVTSQFYAIGIDPETANDNVIAGGLQDNGNYSTFSNDYNTGWIDWGHGADGGFAEVRKNNASNYTIYLEGQNGWLFRQQYNAGGTLIADDFIQPNYTGEFAFVNPFILDLNNPDIFYFTQGDSVLRSTNITAGTPAWQVMTNATTGNFITALSISKVPANRLYVGGGSGEVLKIDGANSGDPNPVDISAGLPQAYVNCIYVDPANADNVIVVLSNYSIISIWSSNNGGNSWTNISGNLEQNPDGSGNGPSVRWITSVFANGVRTYFAAASTGVYSTTTLNGAATVWVQEGANTIGNVVSTMVKSRDSDGLVVVATHGKGVYSTSLLTDVDDAVSTPNDYALSQNYPNPFNPTTTIQFNLQKESFVQLKVFDAIGREVKTLVNEERPAGSYSIKFDAAKLSSGIYYYRIATGKYTETKKMILLK